MKKKKLPYWYAFLIAVDQLVNTILWGSPDETLSSRAYRNYWVYKMNTVMGKYRWVIIYHLVNAIFFDRNHCLKSFESEKNRTHYPIDWETKGEQ